MAAKYVKIANYMLDTFRLHVILITIHHGVTTNQITKGVKMEKLSGTKQQETADEIREEILDEIADLEEYARLGKQPPHCRGYRIRVNGEKFVVNEPFITGRDVLKL